MTRIDPPTTPIRIPTTDPIPYQQARAPKPRNWRARLGLLLLTWQAHRLNPRIHIHNRITTPGPTIRNTHTGHRYHAWHHKCIRCGHTRTTYTATGA